MRLTRRANCSCDGSRARTTWPRCSGRYWATGELSFDGLAEAVINAGGEAALRDFVRANDAADLVQNDQRDALLDHFREALKRFAFDCGVGFDRIAGIAFESESFQRSEAVEAETRPARRAVAGGRDCREGAARCDQRRLHDLGDLLARLESATGGDASTQWHQLLPALSPADRGRLLENLWRITPDRHVAEAIVVVAGRECIWLSATEPELIAQRVVLDDELGGLRSVAFSAQHNWLLVGAALGVWALDATTGEVAAKFVFPMWRCRAPDSIPRSLRARGCMRPARSLVAVAGRWTIPAMCARTWFRKPAFPSACGQSSPAMMDGCFLRVMIACTRSRRAEAKCRCSEPPKTQFTAWQCWKTSCLSAWAMGAYFGWTWTIRMIGGRSIAGTTRLNRFRHASGRTCGIGGARRLARHLRRL